MRLQYPSVIFNTDLSGIKMTIGQSVQVKNLRSNKGFPDIVIYEPRGKWHGLFIELKKEGTKLAKKNGEWASEHISEQVKCMNLLVTKGYYAIVAIGFQDAKDIIDHYLKLK
ncbi:MAG: hypothetical protein WC139_13215 [Candidatus Kapaibacterium sp.]